ncbi:nucleoside triphosphate pyrophosphohydrolase family protein [Vibrio sp. SCSIO 43137]|uniref:nucleoside triphosphate pyrophosphohydrolase family protein n=1 Tax=Vibrio sp. SCSIO 43137 TaxID=3021011 RepID=UPI002307B274|nr:nucleoside triphosphate pyrophosphohydrolase family protein [Vibrio sp. SCSIO 43137]WCE28431.1 nucleoside triphosphate pyrophosphohydrolase family protein [Vibrio sp. SCSIO 43137]
MNNPNQSRDIPMKLNDYQQQATVFARYAFPDYPFVGLQEEVGEVAGKLAKYQRKFGVTMEEAVGFAAEPQDSDDQDLRDALKKELGDVLWQVAAAANELGLTLEDVATGNLDKLNGRAERDTLVGEGDDR